MLIDRPAVDTAKRFAKLIGWLLFFAFLGFCWSSK
jgi:hypothetical protein